MMPTVETSLSLLLLPILIPLVTGVLSFLIRRLRNEIAIAGSLITFYFALRIFILSRYGIIVHDYASIGPVNIGLHVDGLSAFVLLASAFLGLMAIIYSRRAMRESPGVGSYYLFIMFTIACANGVFMASDMLIVVFFWGFLAATLYGMLFLSKKDSSVVAMKGFFIAATADLLLMTGIGILLFNLGDSGIAPATRIPLTSGLAIASFFLLTAGALAKAGSMPFHTWIPDAAGTAPATFLGFIPGAIDKLLGIYLMVRISTYIFDISTSMAVRNVIMGVGALTIMAAVMMALVQKEAYRLLSFHAISQVGYMVLGIGTGNPIGIAGGLFHMVNHAIYKSTLFYSVGSVEYRTGETRLDRLGGLATRMPLTTFSFLIAALAISGIPPLNGFVSKWMVYQGIIQLGQEGNKIYPLFLIAAMQGSVFTLASFLKLLHSMFLGSGSSLTEKVREVGFSMWFPTVTQAVLCIAFGVFAMLWPIPMFILPSLRNLGLAPIRLVDIMSGYWQPTLATGLIIVALTIGFIVYLVGTLFKPRRVETFVGGEKLSPEEERMPGTEFYSPMKELGPIHKLYATAESGAYDFYNIGIKTARNMSEFVYNYIDRLVDRFYSVASDIIVMFGKGAQSVAGWFFLLLLIPIFIFAGSRDLRALQYLALALMIGAALMALVENSFHRFFLLIGLAQLGLVILAFSRGGITGVLAGIYQIYNSAVAYITIYLAYRLIMQTRAEDRIQEFHGVSDGMPIAALAFIVGGLSLAGMPPSGNFFSKYLLASIYSENMTYIMIIIFVALLMLGVMLRVISQVFFGKPNMVYQEKHNRLYYATLVITILAIFNGVLSKPLVDLLSIIFRMNLQ
jgi:formate hydrogenlyase subunit 3/multisubunit Na+/H+ antiporter MnhD subunit